MESDKLYRVKKEDLPKLEELLNICFAHDPLYETLIPDPDVIGPMIGLFMHDIYSFETIFACSLISGTIGFVAEIGRAHV